jgi:hypothetical protein
METCFLDPVWCRRQTRGAPTLESLWRYLGWPPEGVAGQKHDGFPCPEWPPDLFALCASALRKSGAYTLQLDRMLEERDNAAVRRIGREWRDNIGNELLKARSGIVDGSLRAEQPLPQGVMDRWRRATAASKRSIAVARLMDDETLVSDLLELLAFADEACVGVGLPMDPRTAHQDLDRRRTIHAFHDWAQQTLFPTQFGSTLCRYVHPSIARVLPKMHTAQFGLTIRSFSNNLAFCESEEVQPTWLAVPGARGDVENNHHFNVLIAPWPKVVTPAQIRRSKEWQKDHKKEISEFRYFTFASIDTDLTVASDLNALAAEAERITGSLDAVVMPELALTDEDYRGARRALLRRGLMFVAGVGGSRNPVNYLAMDVPLSKHHAVHLRQRKHHRWKVESHQIKQYGLGARLNPEHEYWEELVVNERKLMFVALRPWLVTTALICEDLARHDPVGELLRGVGPNLVIALLMDGPQLSSRWAARYAAGLADDPGCSVLSVTSLGMAELSRPEKNDTKLSRVVALWKDQFSGTRELELPAGSDGLVITLAVKWKQEQTADLRSDKGVAGCPQLAGIHAVKLPEARPRPEARPTVRWISPFDAALLSRLAQEPDLTENVLPREVGELKGEAFRIGREIWRMASGGSEEVLGDPNWASAEERDTAKQIREWHRTNFV